MKIKGNIVKQVNRLQIRHSDLYQYSIWTPDGKNCIDDRFPTLESAVIYCKMTKDFLAKTKKQKIKEGKSHA